MFGERKRFSKDMVMNDMIKRIEEWAKEMWVSVDEYYKIREHRKNRVKSALNTVRKKWDYKWVHIRAVSNYNSIKWWLLELWTDNENITIKAYVSQPGWKPHIMCDYDQLTYAEKNKMRRTVYGYFSWLQKS